MIKCTFEDEVEVHLRHAVVDSLVLKDKQILLIKRAARLSEGGKWALVGGFLELDETIEEGAAREIHEETGWKVTNLKLLRINDGPRKGENRQNIAFVYTCEATEKTGEADDESEERRWFSFDSLPPTEEIAFDHADNIAIYLRTIDDESE